jgi:hypothetical protein
LQLKLSQTLLFFKYSFPLALFARKRGLMTFTVLRMSFGTLFLDDRWTTYLRMTDEREVALQWASMNTALKCHPTDGSVVSTLIKMYHLSSSPGATATSVWAFHIKIDWFPQKCGATWMLITNNRKTIIDVISTPK